MVSMEGNAGEDSWPLTRSPGGWPEYWWHQWPGRGQKEGLETVRGSFWTLVLRRVPDNVDSHLLESGSCKPQVLARCLKDTCHSGLIDS